MGQYLPMRASPRARVVYSCVVLVTTPEAAGVLAVPGGATAGTALGDRLV